MEILQLRVRKAVLGKDQVRRVLVIVDGVVRKEDQMRSLEKIAVRMAESKENVNMYTDVTKA